MDKKRTLHVANAAIRASNKRIAALEAENERVRALPQLVLDKLEQPGGIHRYFEGIHQSDCGACHMREWLRTELAKTGA